MEMNSFHQDVWEMETAGERGDRAWSRYVDKCCALIGVSDLDGDELVDGHSIDSANDAFRAGVTPAQYAAGKRVKHNWRGR